MARRDRKCCASVSMTMVMVAAAVVPMRSAEAHKRDFPVTYDWLQPSKGEKELELHETYSVKSREAEHQLEFEYGITNRWMVAPYLVYTQGPDEHLNLSAVKVETRYQLGSYATNKFLPGLYLEYEKPKGEKAEIEGKLILSRYSNNGNDFSLNLVAEHQLESGAHTRYAITGGYSAAVGGKGIRLGAEAYKDLDSGRVNAGPTLAFAPAPGLWTSIGYSFPVNGHDGEQQANALLEYEF